MKLDPALYQSYIWQMQSEVRPRQWVFVSFFPFFLRKKLSARSSMLFLVKLLILGSFVNLRRTMCLLSYSDCVVLNFLADIGLYLLSQKKVQGYFLTGNQGKQEFLSGCLCFWRREALCGWYKMQSENHARAGCQTRIAVLDVVSLGQKTLGSRVG